MALAYVVSLFGMHWTLAQIMVEASYAYLFVIGVWILFPSNRRIKRDPAISRDLLILGGLVAAFLIITQVYHL